MRKTGRLQVDFGPLVDTHCVDILTNECLNSSYRIIKIIRLSMDFVQTMLGVFPNLKVIHLVRDPRGITNSRLHGGFRMSKDPNSHDKNLCNRLLYDVKIGALLKEKFPDRITMVMYEALAERPTEGAKYIYRFLEIEYNHDIEVWVNMSSNANADSGFYSTKRINSNVTSSHWRGDLSFDRTNIIQNYCENIFKLLGYVAFRSKSEMLNMNLPSRKPSDRIKGFI